jgi:transcriptional repressor NrdR
MDCPHCGHAQHRVIDTREAGDAIRRRRQCEGCGQRFTTYENVAADLLVTKSDGRREPFDRQKLLRGIQLATVKRPISSASIEHMVDQILEALHGVGRSEVASKTVGRMVLDHLAHLDQVAYIRFASVYLDVKDLIELRTELERLMAQPA